MKTTKNTTKEAVINAIVDYFQEHEDVFTDCIEELDSYDGYLGADLYYSMEELDEIFSETAPSELLQRAFFGHDENDWTLDRYGNKEYGAFNPNRDYFRFNGYGNLVSADCKDYSAHLDHYAVESMSENRSYIDSIDENDDLAALFDALEEAEDEEIEE